jgi:hypothetical protein
MEKLREMSLSNKVPAISRLRERYAIQIIPNSVCNKKWKSKVKR